ncbi:MAG: hypothetical protein R2792_09245 [Saprospiraceae bacterium]
MLLYWASLFPASLFLLLHWAKWKLYRYFHFELEGIEQLNAKEKKRIQHYQNGTQYLSALFSSLGQTNELLPANRKAYSTLAALAATFDDLSDLPGIKPQNKPEDFAIQTDPKLLSISWLKTCRENIPGENAELFEHTLQTIFSLETQTPDSDHLGEHAARKGGLSVLLFRCMFPGKTARWEQEVWMAFGAYIQLCDDIFDVWFDRQAGVLTEAVKCMEAGNLTQLIHRFESSLEALEKSLQDQPNARRTQNIIQYLTVVTRVCLQHYLYLQKKHRTLPLNDRTQMVVDMAKWSNRFKCIQLMVYPHKKWSPTKF